MKYLVPVLCVVAVMAVLAGVEKKDAPKPAVEAPKVVVDWDHLERRDDLWHFEEKPFTGRAVRKYKDGQKWNDITYKGGKLHGLRTWWYKNGQKRSEATFKTGKMISEKQWDKDGKPMGQDQGGEVPPAVAKASKVVHSSKIKWRNGLAYSKGKLFTGVAVGKYPSGQKRYEETFRDGKKRLKTSWYQNYIVTQNLERALEKEIAKSNWDMQAKQRDASVQMREKTQQIQKQLEPFVKYMNRDGSISLDREKDAETIQKLVKLQKEMNSIRQQIQEETIKAIIEAQKQLQIKLKEGDDKIAKLKKNGQKEFEKTFRDGKYHGLVTRWYENGQKEYEETFKDGKYHGLATGWHENGQKRKELTFKDDKEDGLLTEWYSNGQKALEVTYEDGKKHGLLTRWYQNGQKLSEFTFKDGKRHGMLALWHENGQKAWEGTFKDGEEISFKSWDEDGNPK